MPVIINGSTGITNVNGSASTPAETGTDTDTGIYYGTNTVGLATNGTNALFIDASQNVGIGTSSPNKKLEVLGAGEIIRATSNNAAADQLISVKNNSGTADCSTNIFFADRYAASSYASSYIRGTTSGISALIFATGGTNFTNIYDAGAPTERMRIDSSGFVYMNTTSNWSGNAILNVVGANWVVSGYSTGTATNTGAFLSRVDNTNCRLMMFYYGATTNVGYITTNGTTTSYGSASDYRLKENIAPMTGALAKVALLKPVTYTWKSDGSDGQGFIAHELQEVVPNCVAGEKDAVDAEGNPQYQAVDTSFLVATLTAAIQEQQALITALTARIEALENK